MDTIRVMNLDQKSRFLMLGPCSSGGTSPFFACTHRHTHTHTDTHTHTQTHTTAPCSLCLPRAWHSTHTHTQTHTHTHRHTRQLPVVSVYRLHGIRNSHHLRFLSKQSMQLRTRHHTSHKDKGTKDERTI